MEGKKGGKDEGSQRPPKTVIVTNFEIGGSYTQSPVLFLAQFHYDHSA